MAVRNDAIPEEDRIQFCAGINLGDVIVEDGDIPGDGVNVAARLEGIAKPEGICVSGIVHDKVQGRLDCGFADIGEQSLKNIARPIRVYRVGPKSPLPNPPPHTGREARKARGWGQNRPCPCLTNRRSSGDPEQEYFADGMVEEIITALSRIRWLFVIARNSTFTYKGRAIDVKQIGRELGVCYVLEGSVRKGAGRVRITTQLIDATTGTHLWADRFDGSLEDIFELQDKVASRVAGLIEPALQAAETARSASRPKTDPTAYDLYLRVYAMLFSSTREIPEAIYLLEQAIEREPRYGLALALAALCCLRQVYDDRSTDPQRDREKGTDFARRALEASSGDPGVLANAALALGYFVEDIGAMMVLVDRALALNPNHARGWHSSGVYGRASPTSRSSMSRHRCGSVRAPTSAGRNSTSAPTFLGPALCRGGA